MNADQTAHLEIVDALGLSELDAFRATIRSWLVENVPHGWRDRMTGASHEEYVTFQQNWFATLAKAGYAAPHWPQEWGGGFSQRERVILAEELARADAPRIALLSMSLFHAAATLLQAGSAQQKQRHLPAILRGEVWCQLFSEPEAGSDLASLRTRAVRDGDDYVINGQKIWSSHAHEADFGLLLARTGTQEDRHRGLTYFILDMHSPGVTIRPITQSTGQQDFNEVFLDGVAIPASEQLGQENEGWAIAQSTLSSERGTTMLDLVERLRSTRSRLARDIAAVPATDPRHAVLTDRYAAIHAEVEVLRLLVFSDLQETMHEKPGGGNAPVLKLAYSETLRRLDRLGLSVLGPSGQLEQPIQRNTDWESGNWIIDYLASWGWTVGGGTSEIMRNLIAERTLGLPRDPRPAQPSSKRDHGGRDA
jgi:alkylation response protein AidB-like acyl-CoA dehydrogenase